MNLTRRSLLAVAMLLAAWNVSALAMVPDEAAGIPWGTLPGALKLALKDRPGVALEEETPDHLTFQGGDLSGKPVKSRRFDLRDGKMSRLTVSFVYPTGADARGSLADHARDDLLALLVKKYGPVKDQAVTDVSHLWQWTWPHPVVRGFTRQIRLTQNWKENSLTLIYLDNEPVTPPTPASTPPVPAPTPKVPNEL